MKLAIVQIVLGALIVSSLVWFIGWVEWNYGSLTILREGIEVEMLPLPGWMVRMISWKAASFVLGLGVVGLGIAQFVKVRRLRGAESL